MTIRLFIFSFLLSAFNTNAQCPEGSIILNTISDLNAFESAYPDCTEIDGDLSIRYSTDITNLAQLQNIKRVNGSLIIEENEKLAHIQDLELTFLGGNLEVKKKITLIESNCCSCRYNSIIVNY